MKYFIGIDDTDNPTSRGTAHKARLLAEAMAAEQLCTLMSITKHRHFKGIGIPSATENTSACIEIKSSNLHPVISFCRNFLSATFEQGSNPAFCILPADIHDTELHHFGLLSKSACIDTAAARALAEKKHLHCESITEAGYGIVGALGACALRASGNDGRFIWLQGLPKFKTGIYTVIELQIMLDIDRICLENGVHVPERDSVFVPDQLIPLLREDKKTIFVEEVRNYNQYQWETLHASYLKSIA